MANMPTKNVNINENNELSISHGNNVLMNSFLQTGMASDDTECSTEILVHDKLIDEHKTVTKSLSHENALFTKRLLEKDNVIKKLKQERQQLHIQLKKKDKRILELESLIQDQPMSSTSVRESYTAKLPEQQNVKIQKPKSHSIISNQSNSVCSITNEHTPSVQSQSISSKKTKGNTKELQELSMLTVDKPYFTVLGNYKPEENKTPVVEIPRWKIKNYDVSYSKEGTEDMTDEAYKNRHAKPEAKQIQENKWNQRQTRDFLRNEHLKKRFDKRDSLDLKKEEFTSFLPKPTSVKTVEITNDVPVFAFGQNHYKIKNSEPEMYRSKWIADAKSKMARVNKSRGHSSSVSDYMKNYLEPQP